MILIVKRLVRKLPILLGFIFVLFFATSIKDDFIGHIGIAEVNLTKITMNNSGLSGSNTTQINMNVLNLLNFEFFELRIVIKRMFQYI